MKKLIILITIIAMVCLMGISALAAPGGFVESPSSNGAPTIVTESTDKGVSIIAYRERAGNLSADMIANFESAYKSVVSYTDVSSMNSELSGIANKVKVDPADLAVSDLFYVVVEGDAAANVSLMSNTFGNLVTLVRFNGEGWDIVKSEIKDGVVSFSASSGVYAAVISTGSTPVQPDNGCLNTIGIIGIICVASAAIGAGVYVYIRKRKKQA